MCSGRVKLLLSCRLPETHQCTRQQDIDQRAKDINQKRLNEGKCISDRLDDRGKRWPVDAQAGIQCPQSKSDQQLAGVKDVPPSAISHLYRQTMSTGHRRQF